MKKGFGSVEERFSHSKKERKKAKVSRKEKGEKKAESGREMCYLDAILEKRELSVSSIAKD